MNARIAIIEFGSQHTLQIGRCLRDLGYNAIIIRPEEFEERNLAHHFRGVIGSGGFRSVYEKNSPELSPLIMPQGNDNPIPYLGICFGMQLSIQQSGGTVLQDKPEYAETIINIHPSLLFKGLSSPRQRVWMSHGDRVAMLPRDFEILAVSEDGVIAAVRHARMPHYGVQFHPEVSHTPEGRVMLKNFVEGECGLAPDYMPDSLPDLVGERILREVGPNDHAILLYSGGVDSSVVASAGVRVLGKRLHAVTFDAGHLRENETEEIRRNAGYTGVELTVLDISSFLIRDLSTTTDPEEKREIFRRAYADSARQFAHERNATKIIQGTIAPDRIESGMTGAARIKTHHNSAGLNFGSLTEVHPIDFLFKDEVRTLAQQLGLPLEIFNRPPFPGPGNFIRVVSIPMSREVLDAVQWAEARVREMVAQDPRYRDISQLVVAALGRSVGVKGDKRVYGYNIAVRGVRTLDFMTAEGVEFEPDFQRIVKKKLGEHPLITQTGFFPTDKPPGTTEFE